MIGFSEMAVANGVPFRSCGPTDAIAASVLLSGEQPQGTTQGEERTLYGLMVTNNRSFPVSFEIEQEGTDQSYTLTVQPGQTASAAGLTLTTYWNAAARPAPRWDGINIRTKEPA